MSTLPDTAAPDVAELFLSLLAPDGELTFQTFDDSNEKRGHLVRVIHGNLNDKRAELQQLNADGAGVFVAINKTDGKGRTIANINVVRAVFIDFDRPSDRPLERIANSPLKPNLIVESSPGKFHAYWFADLPLDQFEAMQKTLAAHFGSDPSVCDLPRVMRVPGFYHNKGEPFLTRIHVVNRPEPYTYAQLRAAFTNRKPRTKSTNYTPPELVCEGERDNALTKFAGWRRHAGDDDEQLLEQMLAFNAARFDPPFATAEIEKKHRHFCKAFEQKQPTCLHARTRCMADIQPQQVKWLWSNRIALGKLTLIAGNPGLGKSLITTAMASCVSVGGTWPDKSPCLLGDVLILSAEDDPADTIRPRLDAAGADTSRIHILDGVFDPDAGRERLVNLDSDIRALAEALSALPECRLVIIDPISAYMGTTDSHNNAEVRGLLADLAQMAAEHGAAVVVVSHLNKSQGAAAAYRVTGSLAFTAACRAAYAVIADPEEPARRIFTPIKNNLGNDTDGFAYRVESNSDNAPVVSWESEPVTQTADELLAKDPTDKKQHPRQSAALWLRELLKPGPMRVEEIQERAEADGHTWRTVQRAKNEEFIVHERAGYQGPVQWRVMNRAEVADGELAEEVLY